MIILLAKFSGHAAVRGNSILLKGWREMVQGVTYLYYKIWF
mgnify:CR=1 FL=1